MDKIVDTLHRRTVLSVIYTIVLQTIIVLIFAFSHTDVFHPLMWICDAVSKLTTFSVCVLYIIVCSLFAALCGVTKSRILCGPVLLKSRLDSLKYVFSLNTVFQSCLYVIIGVMVSCLYLSIIGGKFCDLRRSCNYSAGFCVSEEKVFLLYSGAMSGLYVFMRNFLKNYYISFPVIQQLSFLRIKAEVLPSLKYAMKVSIFPCILFPILYIANGSVVLHLVSDIFNLTIEDKLFSKISDCVRLSLLFYLWLQTTILTFSCKMMENTLNILLTDVPEFPIACQFGELNVGTLHDVIAAYKYPIIQNWGCLDLASLGKSDENRRKEIFSLSHPGGHPNNWNLIRTDCIQLFDSFVQNINVAVSEMVSSQTDATVPSIPSETPVPRITREMTPALRNLSVFNNDIAFQCEQLNDEPFNGCQKIFEIIAAFVKRMISPVLKKSGLSLIFDQFPDAQLKHVLSDSLPVINAVQGLSYLVAASVTEDDYGVVRKDLNSIIIAIQQLKLTVDRALKLGNFKRTHRNDYDVQMRATLKSALRRSLYKICIAFGNNLQEMDLPPSVLNNLQVYLSFRE